MLIEFRNAFINLGAIAAIVPYKDGDGGTYTVDLLVGARGMTFNEVTQDELNSLISAYRDSFERWRTI